ncbi:MAG: FAD-dependent oxidoreductase, partial [Defluviitaleaceae bacterium]|nr:FAD-dependent oxidoreductase [Defluviitaleaceae bacterium]
MLAITIDGRAYTGQPGQTVLEIAQGAGVFIPSLCFDGRVAASGACGLCLVELEGASRPVRACATVIAPGMAVRTDAPPIRAAQKRILELLLSTHAGDCVAPCRAACPAETDCAGYIKHIAQGEWEEAAALLYEAHPFPASVARICPRPCEKKCRRANQEEAVNIAALKQYGIDVLGQSGGRPFPADAPFAAPAHRVAILGGGPAGLTAGYFLRRAGHGVTVYDRAPQMGGLLRYGIPEYRLPKEILDAELAVLEEMGIRFVNETALGPSGALTLDALRAENDAVIVAVGASRSKPLGCPGDALPGVLGGTDFLMRVALGDISQGRPISGKVVVVGGSNTAIDAARTAMRVGATHVIVAYRRTRAEMPAEPQEIAEAEAEGVVFKFLAAPMEITPDGIRLQAMTLGDPDASGRRAPVPLPGEQEWLEADMIISAIGQAVETQGLEALQATRWNTLAAHPQTFATNLPGVFAIGDATGQSAYAIEAMAHARKAAAAVHAYINEESGIAPPGLPQALPP